MIQPFIFIQLFIVNKIYIKMTKIQLTETDLHYIVNECVKKILTENVEEGKFGKFLGTAALGAALAMGAPTPANAQLNIQNQVAQEPRKIMSLGPMGDNVLYKTEDYGYIIQCRQYGVTKSNASAIASPFIPDGITIVLGNNEKSALLTLKDLKNLIVNDISEVTFKQKWLGDEELLQLNYDGKNSLSVSIVRSLNPIVGFGQITLQAIDNGIEYFNNTFYIDDSLSELQDEYNKLRKLYYGIHYKCEATDNPTEKEMMKAQMLKIQQKMNEIENEIIAIKQIPNSSYPKTENEILTNKDTKPKKEKNFGDGIYSKK